MRRIFLGIYSLFVFYLLSLAKLDRRGMAVNSLRHNLVNNLAKDIKGFLKSGKSKSEIFNYYWQVKPFRKLWINLDLDEKYLEKLIRR